MKVVFGIGAAALVLALAACDAGPSASGKAPTAPSSAPSSSTAVSPDASASTVTAGPASGAVGQSASAADPRDLPVPLVDGKPMWAANRQHTAQENADYQFGKNGKDFGAGSEADYVARVHHFVESPPAGVQKLERANGDSLLYDAKSNTFAVVTKAGAPRTMFKPRDGAAYWRQQVDRASARSNGDDSSQS